MLQTGMPDLIRCRRCHAGFYGRADAQYCSAACRQAAHRERRDGRRYPVKPNRPPKPTRPKTTTTEWKTKAIAALRRQALILSKAAVEARANGTGVVTVRDADKIANTFRWLAHVIEDCYADHHPRWAKAAETTDET